MRLLIGPPGAGKTRLAYEFLWETFRERSDVWDSGVVEAASLRRDRDWDDWIWRRPTLLVIDDAHASESELTQMFLALARRGEETRLPPLRVMLLERDASAAEGWFRRLLEQEDDVRGGPVRELFDPPEPVNLSPIDGPQIRRRILTETLQCISTFRGRPTAAVPQPKHNPKFDSELQDRRWEDPLSLMMAALEADRSFAVRSGAEFDPTWDSLRMARSDLAETVAKHELRRLDLFVPSARSDSGVGRRLLRHMAACVTLCGGLAVKEVAEACDEESSALRLNWTPGSGDLADRLQRAYPARDGGTTPIQPDIVGEAAAYLVLTDGLDAAMQRECVSRNSRRNAAAVADSVIRLTRDFVSDAKSLATIANWLEAVVAANPPAPPRIHANALQALAEAASFGGKLDESITRTRRAVETIAPLALKDPETYGVESIGVRFNYVEYLRRIGRAEDAMAEALISVAACRKLVEGNVAGARARLGAALSEAAILASTTGDNALALRFAHEGVAIRKALLRDDSAESQADLAKGLNTLANRLEDAGDRDGAISTLDHSITLWRRLARGGEVRFRLDLIKSLDNRTRKMLRAGRERDAEDSAREALTLFAGLVKVSPRHFTSKLVRASLKYAGYFGQRLNIKAAKRFNRAAFEALTNLRREHPSVYEQGSFKELTEFIKEALAPSSGKIATLNDLTDTDF